MRPARYAPSTLAALFLALAARAEPEPAAAPAASSAPVASAAPGAPAEDPAAEQDLKLIETLKESQELYEEGVRELEAGRARAGRKRLSKAFSGLAGTIDDARLAVELKSDFASMLEKVRTWDGAQAESDEPDELDAAPEQLHAEPSAPVLAPVAKGAIPLDPENVGAK